MVLPGLVTEFFNLQTATEHARELLSQPVPLNQFVDEPEAVATRTRRGYASPA
jgi:hypothetical protein